MLHSMNVAIRFIAYDLMTPSMMKMAASMKLFDRNVSLVETRLKQMRGLMVGGAAALGIGAAGIFGIAKLISPANEYVHLLSQANSLGMTHQEIAKGVQKAWETTAKVQTVSVNEAMKMLLDLRFALGDPTIATRFLPQIAQLKTVFTLASERGLTKGTSQRPTEMAYSAVKVMEQLGKTKTAEEFTHHMNMLARVTVGTSGRVTPIDYMGTVKYLRQSAFGLDERFLYGVLPSLILAQKTGAGGAGGTRGGPAVQVAAFHRAVVQGLVSKKALTSWSALGLVDKQGTIVGRDLATEDPEMYYRQVLRPAIIKHHPYAKQKDILQVINTLGFSQTATSLMDIFEARSTVIAKDIVNIFKTQSIEGILKTAKTDPYTAYAAAKAQGENVRVALGTNTILGLLPFLNKFSDWLNSLAQFLIANPSLADDLVKISSALAVALGVGGLLTLLSTLISPIGAVAIGITALAVAIERLLKIVSVFKEQGPTAAAAYASNTAFGSVGGLRRKITSSILMANPITAPLGLAVNSIGTKTSGGGVTMGDVWLDAKKVGKAVFTWMGEHMANNINTFPSSTNFGELLPTTAFHQKR